MACNQFSYLDHDDGLVEYPEDIFGTATLKASVETALADVERLGQKRAEKRAGLRIEEKESDGPLVFSASLNHLHTLTYVSIFLWGFCFADFFILSLLQDVTYSPLPHIYSMPQGICLHMDVHLLAMSPPHPDVRMYLPFVHSTCHYRYRRIYHVDGHAP
jgi:hypothetical protein